MDVQFTSCVYSDRTWCWHFFFVGFLLRNIHESQDSRGRGRPILTPLYHFHMLQEYLDISWAITAESSDLYIASGRTQIGNP